MALIAAIKFDIDHIPIQCSRAGRYSNFPYIGHLNTGLPVVPKNFFMAIIIVSMNANEIQATRPLKQNFDRRP